MHQQKLESEKRTGGVQEHDCHSVSLLLQMSGEMIPSYTPVSRNSSQSVTWRPDFHSPGGISVYQDQDYKKSKVTYLPGRGPCGGSWWPPPAVHPGWGATVVVEGAAGEGGGLAGWQTEEDYGYQSGSAALGGRAHKIWCGSL